MIVQSAGLLLIISPLKTLKSLNTIATVSNEDRVILQLYCEVNKTCLCNKSTVLHQYPWPPQILPRLLLMLLFSVLPGYEMNSTKRNRPDSFVEKQQHNTYNLGLVAEILVLAIRHIKEPCQSCCILIHQSHIIPLLVQRVNIDAITHKKTKCQHHH